MTDNGSAGSNAAGCGCLALIALVIVGLIGSCNTAQPTPPPRSVVGPATSTTTPYGNYYYPSSTTTSTSTSPTSTTTSRYSNGDDDDYDRPYVPAPRPGRTHSGNSGHPCLPGERDGDNDGYCGEGR